MVEFIGIIIIIGIYVFLTKGTEWKAGNHMPPEGYRMDYGKMNYDRCIHGQDYVNRKTIQGGYDVKINNPKIGI